MQAAREGIALGREATAMAIVLEPNHLPYVNIPGVPEYFVDCLGPIQIVGQNFWT